MIQQVISPVMVGRDQELSRLEDALLAANRGGSRFVALAGEGIGKTRLCLKLQERAHKLGLTVMSGGCSEADLTLPYLPLLEALGNFLATEDPGAIGTELGAARHELAQLFPQLAAGHLDSPPGDPTQAKMRLFESIVALLSIPARRTGLLLVVEDIHWADSSSRELLDYISRLVRGLRVMVVVTYRDDELHRRHPLVPTLQGWRRSGLVVVIELGELTGLDIGRMIAAIFDTDELSNDFRDLMHHHSEGNPFVLEEMLKEALDRGDIYRTGAGWERKSLEQVRVPDTVRDTILLRVHRLEPAVVHVLEAASVLGRVFDYQTLVATAAMDETAVQKALEVAVREQLAQEDRTSPGRYQFRHGLTQEAIYSEILVPRRQEMHSRAADALATRGQGTDFEVAFHLLGAHRHQEAVPACARGAEQAILCALSATPWPSTSASWSTWRRPGVVRRSSAKWARRCGLTVSPSRRSATSTRESKPSKRSATATRRPTSS